MYPNSLLFRPDDLITDGDEKYFVLGEIPMERLQALPFNCGQP